MLLCTHDRRNQGIGRLRVPKIPVYIQVGVNIMTVDNHLELDKIKLHYPEAKVVIRIQIGDPTALVKLSSKFGIEPTIAAPALLRQAIQMGLSVIGVSFHVGGGCNDPSVYTRAIEHARRLFDLAECLGQHMTLLDIGGGYPGYCTADISLYKISVSVNAAIGKYFSTWENFNAIAEPGRYFAMPSSTLCANVFAKRACALGEICPDTQLPLTDARMYYITDGVFNSFNCVPVYKLRPPFEIISKDQTSSVPKIPSRIWGPTCDSADCLFDCIELPELCVGDWLMFTYMGAYTSCISTNFNGMAVGKTHYVVVDCDRIEVMALLRKQARRTTLDSIGRPSQLDVEIVEEPASDDSGCDTGGERTPEPPTQAKTVQDSAVVQETENRKQKSVRRRIVSVAY